MRLFVALLLGESVRTKLAKARSALQKNCDGVRWVPAEQLHLTVKFLGDVKDGDVVGVARALESAAAAAMPFDMEIAGAGCFPERGPVRIVWAGASDPSGRMIQCVEAVSAALERIGFPRESRPWSAHVTIGRVREDRSRGAIRAAVSQWRLDPMDQPVDSVALMSSVLSPKGPTYSVVSTAKLGQGGYS